MARIDNLNNFLTDIANSIRTKEGTEDQIPASEFDTRITNLPTGGATGDVWIDGNELHINVKKYRDNSEYFNSNLSFPTDFYIEDYNAGDTLKELTIQETDEIVFDLTSLSDHTDIELFRIRQGMGMICINIKRTNGIFIIGDAGFDVGQYNG